MTSLTRAHDELFRREPDEQFTSLSALFDHCQYQKETSVARWQLPERIRPAAPAGQELVWLHVGDDGPFVLNDWSFGQLCKLARVRKETLNRLSADTAKRVFYETLPHGNKPLQVFTSDNSARSIHAATYTRLYNADVLAVVQEYATDFQPPPKADADNGGTGLYCGEQDMFAFLIDPTGWVEIDGQAFAPGFFVWNSEVGRRTVGIETFWFQSCCSNHIVWDVVETVEFTRRHTTNVCQSLVEIRDIIARLAAKRDERRDGARLHHRRDPGRRLPRMGFVAERRLRHRPRLDLQESRRPGCVVHDRRHRTAELQRDRRDHPRVADEPGRFDLRRDG